MNTEQKAREWLAEYDTKYVFVDAGNAQEIITALLSEREAFIRLLKDMVESDSLMGRITDEQVIRAIAMCEDKV